jgi:hypothetical protein
LAQPAAQAFDGMVLRAFLGKAKATVVYLAPKPAHKVLVKFENMGSAWDGKILASHLENGGRDIMLDEKKEYVLVTIRDNGITVYPEGSNDGIPMAQDQAATDKLDLDRFLGEFRKQK